MRRSFRSGFVAAALAGAGLLVAPEARANSALSGLDGLAAILVGGVVLGFVDLGLSFPEAGYPIGGVPYPTPFSIAKVVLCAPQTVFYDGVAGYAAAWSGDQPLTIAAALMGGWTGAMTVSGSWALAADIDSRSLYGLSWAIGMNTALTSVAVGHLVGERGGGRRALGIFEMAATVPTLAVSGIRLADPTSERAAWGALAGWSGLIFVHGLVTALRKERGEEPPAPPPEPGPTALGPRFYVGPTVVSDGILRAPGISVSGVF